MPVVRAQHRRQARSSWMLLYLLVDPTTGPTNHGEGTIFYVGSRADGSRRTSAVADLLDLNAVEALPGSVPEAVVERVAALWAMGVAPLVRVLSFGGPAQGEVLDGPRLAALWATRLKPRPFTVLSEGVEPQLGRDAESRQIVQRIGEVREWAVQDYVTVRAPRRAVLPREVPVLVAWLDLRRYPWRDWPMRGLEWTGAPRRWWDLSVSADKAVLYRWVAALREPPLLVLAVKNSPLWELCPDRLVVGVWWGQPDLDVSAETIRIDPIPVDSTVVALRRRLVGGVLTEEDGAVFSSSTAQRLTTRPRPVTAR